ncbi:DUF4190 domain-containing protein [Candidatus Woesearchaeota archaeon]|nr:DUF4190 domain-containing protein [Candidatus Woesearchaeota archaeon]
MNKKNSTSKLAITALILSILIGPVGLILSIVAFFKIRKSKEKGRSISIAGIIIGLISTLLLLPLIISLVAIFGPQKTTKFGELDKFRLANSQITDYVYEVKRISNVTYSDGSNDQYLSNKICEIDRNPRISKCVTTSNRFLPSEFIHTDKGHYVLRNNKWDKVFGGSNPDILEEIENGISFKSIEQLSNENIKGEDFTVFKIQKVDFRDSLKIFGYKSNRELKLWIREEDNLIISAEETFLSTDHFEKEEYTFSNFNSGFSIDAPE